jgi:hypothetical protein
MRCARWWLGIEARGTSILSPAHASVHPANHLERILIDNLVIRLAGSSRSCSLQKQGSKLVAFANVRWIAEQSPTNVKTKALLFIF